MKIGKDDVIGFIVGLLFGAAILKALSETCPNCKSSIPKNSVKCPKCGVYLKWN